MQIEVIFRGPECEKAKTIAVPLDNPLQDLKGTLQDVNHIPCLALYLKGKILLSEQLSSRKHRMRNGFELDLKHYIRIYFRHAKLLRKSILHWVWFNERVGISQNAPRED